MEYCTASQTANSKSEITAGQTAYYKSGITAGQTAYHKSGIAAGQTAYGPRICLEDCTRRPNSLEYISYTVHEANKFRKVRNTISGGW